MITQPYTVKEIKDKIASNDYSAELLLQHCMLAFDRIKRQAWIGPFTTVHDFAEWLNKEIGE